jgi:fibronectin type 3 domain-containing protein
VKVIDINIPPQIPTYTSKVVVGNTLSGVHKYYIVADNKFSSTVHSQELNIDLTAVNDNTVTLSWPSVDGAEIYNIYRTDSSNNTIRWTVDNKNTVFTICDSNYTWILSTHGTDEYYLQNPINIPPAEKMVIL